MATRQFVIDSWVLTLKVQVWRDSENRLLVSLKILM